MALSICQGVDDVDALSGEVVHHVIPKVFDPLTSQCTSSFQSLDYKRSKDCLVLHSDNQCESCESINKAYLRSQNVTSQKCHSLPSFLPQFHKLQQLE